MRKPFDIVFISKMAAAVVVKSKLDNSGEVFLPPCRYGIKCYRKNPRHLSEYSHPDDFVEESCSNQPEENQHSSTVFINIVFIFDKNYIF